MGLRPAIRFGVLGAGLALLMIGIVVVRARASDWNGSGWLRREPASQANSAAGQRSGDGWIHIDRATFIDAEGDFVSAGQIYLAQKPWRVEHQPIVITTYVGILYNLTVPGWQSIRQSTERSTLAFDVRLFRRQAVFHVGVGDEPR